MKLANSHIVFLFYLFCFFYSLVKRRTLQVRLVYLTVALWTAPLVNIARHTLLFRCRVPVVQQPLTSREQIVADPLPQILDGVQQSLVGKQIVDVPVCQCQRSWWESWGLSLISVKQYGWTYFFFGATNPKAYCCSDRGDSAKAVSMNAFFTLKAVLLLSSF